MSRYSSLIVGQIWLNHLWKKAVYWYIENYGTIPRLFYFSRGTILHGDEDSSRVLHSHTLYSCPNFNARYYLEYSHEKILCVLSDNYKTLQLWTQMRFWPIRLSILYTNERQRRMSNWSIYWARPRLHWGIF